MLYTSIASSFIIFIFSLTISVSFVLHEIHSTDRCCFSIVFFFYFAYDITSYHKQMLLCMLRMKKKIEKKTAQLSKNGRLWIDIHTPDCTDLHTFDSAKFKHRLYLFGRKARIFLIWFGIFTWFSLKYTHKMKKKKRPSCSIEHSIVGVVVQEKEKSNIYDFPWIPLGAIRTELNLNTF